MKSLSTVAVLALLNGALADGEYMASGCVLTQTLPTVTVGCSETATINGQAGQGTPQFSNAPPASFSETSTAQGATFTNAPPVSFPGSSSINGQDSQATTQSTPESSNAPPVIASGGSISTGHVNVEMVVASLLACLMPAFIALF
ncbi:hypothetical protein FPANT_13680 [Fusarium pseudoanthophilum]|uniref:Uncharacterized protein n=1 Tax=Fusarium pseudoanthophilum TaxID=48495 RepID=A0A8H5NM88_9HYPO|nr:hypothetical protein FPANT_13680 [Fusarium pseudoanthophilum]